MPTIKSRLNITLSPEVETAVNSLAKRDKTSRAGKAAELLKIALEIEEDIALNAIAERIESQKEKLAPHSKVWK